MRTRSGTAFAGVAALAVAGMALTTAWAHGPTRQKVRESIEINAPPAKVWAAIGNFQDMSWLPPVTKTEGEKGNEIGATRKLTLTGGATVDEELYKFDADAMTYSYRITSVDVKVLPVTNYSSTLAVTPSADGKGSTLEWAGAFYRGFPNNDPPPELNDEAAKSAVSGLYKAGLEALKKKVESGS
ncbi:Polyketide cyclase / dehydrase and lipid transport [Bradyrhizobium sp. YR681]|uniref:SRPBCC family protein n=1 Tax=Bradyrhizobium sp. YR681 TaxID=1144344 RepID=UPI0002710522|nr:SRPBCC family protein [Bradyrhizobium sp. YR681]EJN14286.1 Polyketide cyclase / dehydrase and lipid transport [Bradyrhizobium sp. YR681]